MTKKPIKLYPSGADRWCECPASAFLESTVPRQPSGPHAAQGTAVHCLAQWLIDHNLTPDPAMVGIVHVVMDEKQDKARGISVVGAAPDEWANVAPLRVSGWPVTDAWLSAASEYTALIARIRDMRPAAEVMTEKHLRYFTNVVSGYADSIVADRPGKWFAVIDYKNGRGVVPAERNRQMAIYARAWLREQKDAEKIVCCIVQPNADDGRPAVRVWTTTPDELKKVCEGIDTGITDALDVFDHPETASSRCQTGDHCQWCNAKTICPAQRALVLDAVPAIDDAEITPPPAAELSDDRIGAIMGRIGMVRAWLDAVETETAARLHAGRTVPGWKLVAGRSARKIVDEAGLKAAAAANGWQVMRETLRPLGELDKVVPAAELAKFTEKPAGKPTLAPADDKRKAIETKTDLLEGL
jgi:hypothetical protein